MYKKPQAVAHSPEVEATEWFEIWDLYYMTNDGLYQSIWYLCIWDETNQNCRSVGGFMVNDNSNYVGLSMMYVRNPYYTQPIPDTVDETTIVPTAPIDNTIVPTAPIDNTVVPTAPLDNTVIPTAPLDNTIIPTAPIDNAIIPTAPIDDIHTVPVPADHTTIATIVPTTAFDINNIDWEHATIAKFEHLDKATLKVAFNKAKDIAKSAPKGALKKNAKKLRKQMKQLLNSM